MAGYTNAAGTGAAATHSAPSGDSYVTVRTTKPNSLVVGAGNDWDRAVSHSPVPGQIMLHQDLAPVGDTLWAQSAATPMAQPGEVTLQTTGVADDSYNFAAVEILSR